MENNQLKNHLTTKSFCLKDNSGFPNKVVGVLRIVLYRQK